MDGKRSSLLYPPTSSTLRTRASTVSIFLIVLITTRVRTAGQAVAQSSPDAPMQTLAQAIDIAVHNNRQLRISGLDVVKARESLAETKTNFFPELKSFGLGGMPLQSFSFTVPPGTFGVYPVVGPIPAQTSTITTPRHLTGVIDVSADQPLTQLYKVSLATHEASLGVTLAKEAERGQHQETVRQVKDAYRQLAQAQAEVNSAESSVKYFAELSELMTRNLEQKTVLFSDLLTAKANLEQQRYQLLTLQDALDMQKESFNRLLGRDLRTLFTIEPQPPPDFLELNLEEARKRALEQRPEIREARLQSKMAGMDVRREKAEYIPDLTFRFTYLSFQNIAFLPQNATSLGLALSWQPFDWGYKKHRIDELKAIATQKALSEEDVEQQIVLDVDQKYRMLNEARMLLDARADARAAEQQKLQEMTHRYEQKAILLASLLEQQSAVSKAEAQYQQALATFWTAKADFERALGEE